MMSVARIRGSGSVANYLEHYYGRGGESRTPSEWWGRGAQELKLSGSIDRATFTRILEGELPNGVQLPVGQGGQEKRISGYDLTFRAPKSVSLMALVQGDERLVEAHNQAVTESLEWLQRNAPSSRVTVKGRTSKEYTENLAVARFLHDASREQQPLVHTHALVLNATQREDGEWRAIGDNQAWYRMQYGAGAVYRVRLAELSMRLGYELEVTHPDGRFELKGFDRERHIMPFSTRREQIEEKVPELREQYPQASREELHQMAALATRKGKYEVNREDRLEQWREQCRELGVDRVFAELDGNRRVRGISPSGATEIARDAIRYSMEHIMERQSVAPVYRLEQHAAEQMVSKGRMSDLYRVMGAMERSGDLIRLERGWTTHEALSMERQTVDLVRQGREHFEPLLDPHQGLHELQRIFGAMEKEGKSPTKSQRRGLELVLGTRDQYVGLQGFPGTGKTFVLEQVARVAQEQGYRVRGMAPTGDAAEVLEQSSGIRSQTLASHLIELRQRGAGARELWIVDECSMVGTRAMRDLVRAAEQWKARVILVGDREQLPSIEAGKPFAVLADRAMTVATMKDIIRQQDPELRRSVELTISGQVAEAVKTLGPRIREIPDRGDRLLEVASDYLSRDPTERRDTLLIAVTNRDRMALNATIREGLLERGELGQESLDSTILVRRDLTKAESTRSMSYREGDVVLFRRTYRTVQIENGEYLKVARVDAERGVVHLRGADGRSVEWEPHRLGRGKTEVYREAERDLREGDVIRWTRTDREHGRFNGQLAEVQDIDLEQGVVTVRSLDSSGRAHGAEQQLDVGGQRHWEHGYALTVHAAQGKTRSDAIGVIDSADRQLVGRELWEVLTSRTVNDLTIHTDDATRLPEVVQRSQAQESALEFVEGLQREPEIPELLEEYARDFDLERDSFRDFGQDLERNEKSQELEQQQDRDQQQEQDRDRDQGMGLEL